MNSKSRVTVLVKAYPQPSKKHGETVCCAGLDEELNWKRLYPIRFRQLSSEQIFKRWNIVSVSYSRPTTDKRKESCKVHEESIQIAGQVSKASEKSELVQQKIQPSEKAAWSLGNSLAVIRPNDVSFSWKRRSKTEIDALRSAFENQARQMSMFDKELDLLEPCPFKFSMKYNDEDGEHRKTCADWETSAAFFRLSKKYEEAQVLDHLNKTYCEDYVATGLVFALGNIAARPQTWQLLGIFPCVKTDQAPLFP